MELFQKVEWDIVAAAIGTVITAIVAFYRIRSALPKPRTQLKTDLEIMELIGEEHERYPEMKRSTDILLADIYLRRPQFSAAERRSIWGYRILFGLWTVGFTFWTFYLLRSGWSWWVLLTGMLAFGGLINMINTQDLVVRSRKFRKSRDGIQGQTSKAELTGEGR